MNSILRVARFFISPSSLIIMSRFVGAGIGFLTQFLLVRLIGAHELGLFYAASSLAAVLGVIAAQGYPIVAPRFIARYRNKKDDALFGSFAGHVIREAMIAACVLALAVTIWALLWPSLVGSERLAYVVAGWMIVTIAALNVLTNMAAGMRSFAICYAPEGLFRPLSFFAVTVFAGATGVKPSGDTAISALALITVCIAIVVYVLLARDMPPLRWRPVEKPALSWRWRREAWQTALLAIFSNFFADVGILVSSLFLANTEIAIFGLCLKLAMLIGYSVQIGQQMAVPDMADAEHSGDIGRLRRAAWRSIVLPSAITLASIAVVASFGAWLLSLFGPEFARGRDALLILLAAQLLRSLAGPSTHLLTLSGIQSINMGLAASSLAVLFIASALLMPRYGVDGAAYAVFITYTHWIGFSGLALRWLKKPSVDVLWFVLHALSRPLDRSRPEAG